MNKIENWFKNLDYNKGVQIYQELPNCNFNILNILQRGYSKKNIATLIYELGKSRKKIIINPKRILEKKDIDSKRVFELKKSQTPNEKDKKFNRTIYAFLPKELKPVFIQARDLFYTIVELKVKLNEVPLSNENSALVLQKQIFELWQEKDLLWKQIDHWHEHKTLLKKTTGHPFGMMNIKELYKKQNSIKSSLTQMNKRVNILYKKLYTQKLKTEIIKTEKKIERSEKRMYQHKLNLIEIQKLIK